VQNTPRTLSLDLPSGGSSVTDPDPETDAKNELLAAGILRHSLHSSLGRNQDETLDVSFDGDMQHVDVPQLMAAAAGGPEMAMAITALAAPDAVLDAGDFAAMVAKASSAGDAAEGVEETAVPGTEER
jgi:hypothetical protein